jgi:hypothetical protein
MGGRRGHVWHAMEDPMNAATRRFRFDDLAAAANLPRDPASVRARLMAFERIMEGAIRLPGTSRRFGLDAIIGLVPVLGDVAGALIGSWLVWEAGNLGVSRWKRARMVLNVGVDTAIGAIPLAGDIFDLLFRSNTRNMRLLIAHLDRHHPGTAIMDHVSS